ncbi:MAG: cyclic pyranopterin monophosphate synthase MoaC [Pseudomonadota bacterium]
MSNAPALSHLNAQGEAEMVDVAPKEVTSRTAVAEGYVVMKRTTLAMIEEGTAAKGDVIATARIAGIMAAKRTSDLIPLCHPLAISKVAVTFQSEPDWGIDLARMHVTALVTVEGKTGVEMEALTAVSVACLTIYDMLKAVDKGMRFEGVRLVEKKGGRTGHYLADDPSSTRADP